MTYQSFSPENLRKIFDYENRKGRYLESLFFPEAENLSRKIKEISSTIRKSSNVIVQEENKLIKKRLIEEKNKYLNLEFEEISSVISNINLDFDISTLLINNVEVYSLNKNKYSYFAVKQIQYILSKSYKIKQADRNSIIAQLKGIMSSTFPMYILRTDVKGFYENIDRNKLLSKLNHDSNITLSIKKIIKKILKKYEFISSHATGIPRGIGISAYLSELYMRDFDRKMQRQNYVIFYARYVDDIIVIYAPPHIPNFDISEQKKYVENSLSDLGLKINEEKTTFNIIHKGEKPFEINYLGYRIRWKNGQVIVGLSKEKIKRYIKKIDAMINSYVGKKNIVHSKRDKNKFLLRVQFLTGNTRLWHNKKQAMVGIYFSNRFITKSSRHLKLLDRILKKRLDSINKHLPKEFRKILDQYTFCQGFGEKRFHSFTPKELKFIVKIWNHV